MAVTLELHNRKTKPQQVCMLNLVYPVLQMSNYLLPSYLQNPNGVIVTPSTMIFFQLVYIG